MGLLIGVSLVFISFLFFGREQGTYDILITSGLLIAFLFSMSILFGKGGIKTKLLWMAIVILWAFINHLTEPYIIDHSYRIYINENKRVLNEIDTLLMQKKGDISVLNDSVIFQGQQLSRDEIIKLKESRKKLDVYQIYKSENGIYYGLWGFLDVRLGITYLPAGVEPDKHYRHLAESWFR